MRTVRATLSLPVLLLLLVIIGGVGSHALGRALFQPRQPVVGSINFGELVSGLEQAAAIERQFQAMANERNKEIEQRRDEIVAMEERIAALPPEERTQAIKDEYNLARMNFEYWHEFQLREAEIDRSLLFEDLFRKIQTEAASFAKDQGIDMIVIDDSQQALGLDPRSQLPRDVQLRRQIDQRRLLYVEPSLDVTEQLQLRMNNRYRAAQPEPGAEPGR